MMVKWQELEPIQELLNNCEVYQEIYYSQFEKEEGKMAAAEEGVSVHE